MFSTLELFLGVFLECMTGHLISELTLVWIQSSFYRPTAAPAGGVCSFTTAAITLEIVRILCEVLWANELFCKIH